MIGSRIRDSRLKHRLTQGELAKLVGIPQPTLSDIEHNRYEPKITVASQIAKSLNVTVDWLLNEHVR